MVLLLHSPPNLRSKSPKFVISTGSLMGPMRARPTNAAIDVATPVIVRTPLGISSIYTPGYVNALGIRAPLCVQAGARPHGPPPVENSSVRGSSHLSRSSVKALTPRSKLFQSVTVLRSFSRSPSHRAVLGRYRVSRVSQLYGGR